MTTYKSIKYNISGADQTDIPTSAITSGTFADARISESSVTAHVTATDLQPIKSDITALALREATNEASAAFNLPNQFIETFTDDTNLGTQTDGDRTSGYWGTIGSAVNTTAYRYYKFIYTQGTADGYPKVYEMFFYPAITGGGSEISKSGATLTQNVGGEYGSSNGTSAALDGNTSTKFWMDAGLHPAYTVDFGSGVTQTVKSIKFHWQQHNLCTNIKMYGSNNNSDFDLVMDQDGDESGGGFLGGSEGGALSAA